MTRAACIVVVLLAWVGAADARIPTYIEQEPARPRGTSEDLRVSQFPERSTAGGLRYDLYCPHTTDANPLVVVALDAGETLEHAEPIAHHFAKSGVIVVVVEPAPDRVSYPSRIGAVLDEVLAAQPLEAREPGCTRTEAIGAWGVGRGGVAVAELARTRAAAGQALAAVVTVFAATARETIPDMETPLLVIEGVRVPAQSGPSARSVVISGGEPCDLSSNDDPCRDRPQRPAAARPDDHDLRSASLDRACASPYVRAAAGGGPPTDDQVSFSPASSSSTFFVCVSTLKLPRSRIAFLNSAGSAFQFLAVGLLPAPRWGVRRSLRRLRRWPDADGHRASRRRR